MLKLLHLNSSCNIISFFPSKKKSHFAGCELILVPNDISSLLKPVRKIITKVKLFISECQDKFCHLVLCLYLNTFVSFPSVWKLI